MEDDGVKVSNGILVVRSKSGTSKIQKVLVQTKRGTKKNQVKCRLQKYVREKKASKIPVWIKTYRRGLKNLKKKKSLHSSVKCDPKEEHFVSKLSLQTDNSKRNIKCKVCTLPSSVIAKKLGETADLLSRQSKELKSDKSEEYNVEKEISSSNQNSLSRIHQFKNSGVTACTNVSNILPSVSSIKNSPTLPVEEICLNNQTQHHCSLSSRSSLKSDDSGAQSLSASDISDKEMPKYEPLYSWQNIPKYLLNQDNEKEFDYRAPNPLEEDIYRDEVCKSTNILFLTERGSSESNIDHNSEISSTFSNKEEADQKSEIENKDSPIPFLPDEDEFEDDDDYYLYLSSKNLNVVAPPRPYIVMTQYESNLQSTPKGEQVADSAHKESEHHGDNDSGSDEYYTRYLESGLRPLQSDESKLYLDPFSVRKKKKIEEEGEVKPLLQEIPSDVFDSYRKPKKKKVKKEVKKEEKVDTTTSSEEKSSPTEPTDTSDSGPVKALKEYEDTTYTIETEEIKKEEEEFLPEEPEEPRDSESKVLEEEEVRTSTTEEIKEEEEKFLTPEPSEVIESESVKIPKEESRTYTTETEELKEEQERSLSAELTDAKDSGPVEVLKDEDVTYTAEKEEIRDDFHMDVPEEALDAYSTTTVDDKELKADSSVHVKDVTEEEFVSYSTTTVDDQGLKVGPVAELKDEDVTYTAEKEEIRDDFHMDVPEEALDAYSTTTVDDKELKADSSVHGEDVDDQGLKEDFFVIPHDVPEKLADYSTTFGDVRLKEDFCVHTKDVPEGEFAGYSTSTFDDQRLKGDFCVHTKDVPDGKFAAYSTSTFEDRELKGDFCVHTKDVPEGEFAAYSTSTFEDRELKDFSVLMKGKPAAFSSAAIDEQKLKSDFCTCKCKCKSVPKEPAGFSSSTFDEVQPKQNKKRSLFRFFKKNNICVHTEEPPENDSFSVDTSRLSIDLVSAKYIKPVGTLPSEKTGKATPNFAKGSSESGSTFSLGNHSQSSLLLVSNRDRRRLKSRGNNRINGAESDSKGTSPRSTRFSSNFSGWRFWKRNKKEKRESKDRSQTK